MITIRHIERLFSEQQFRRLYHELISGRPEASAGLMAELARPVPLAALGIIRLDEFRSDGFSCILFLKSAKIIWQNLKEINHMSMSEQSDTLTTVKQL